MIFAKESQAQSQKPALQPIRPPAAQAVILVCEKCGKRADFSGKDLKSELKSLVKERGGKGSVRVAMTGCLDVCPKQGVCVGVAKNGSPAEYFIARGPGAEAAASAILDKVNS